MINPQEIIIKCEKEYANFLVSLITGDPFFPFRIPVGKIPQEYIDLHKKVTELLEQRKDVLGFGYTIIFKDINTRKYGKQSLPHKIIIETELDYVKLLKKQKEIEQFKQNIKLIVQELPSLKPWLINNSLKVIKNAHKWNNILKVCNYFLENPQPNLYIRELPIQIHTKFIESNKEILTSLLEFLLPTELIKSIDSESDKKFEKRFSLKYDEPLLRIRILDQKLIDKYQLHFSDFSIPISEFKNLNWHHNRWIITENKMSFLTLPSLENTIALWGSGYKVQILKSIGWLSQSNIFYWGDLDIDGFKILAQLRNSFPHVISLMMDKQTFTIFQEFITIDNSGSKVKNLDNLTFSENEIFSELSLSNKRLEQEHINQVYVNNYLFNIFCVPS